VLVGQYQSRIKAIRQVQITKQTYYIWRKQYGGMGMDHLKELARPHSALGNRPPAPESIIPMEQKRMMH